MLKLIQTSAICIGLLSPVAAFAQANATGSATMSCPGDKVVWVNTKSKAEHAQGSKYFGKTKHGKYMCQKAADAEGGHLVKNEQ